MKWERSITIVRAYYYAACKRMENTGKVDSIPGGFMPRGNIQKAVIDKNVMCVCSICGIRQRMPSKHVYYYRSPEHHNHYVLSFAFGFDREEDVYQFALSFPYSYSRYQAHAEETLYRSSIKIGLESIDVGGDAKEKRRSASKSWSQYKLTKQVALSRARETEHSCDDYDVCW
ncbi:hypothetical protein B566_EDAN001698 [Ephemera danica]|nr:hypothetical protein B566_EDAN001698 [Ephemera danica]